MYFKKYVYLFLIVLFFSSCKFGMHEFFSRDNNVKTRAVNISKLDINNYKKNNSNEVFSILVINDTHVGKYNFIEAKEKFFSWIDTYTQENEIALCIINGDLTDTGTSEDYEKYIEFTKQIEDEFDIPVLSTLGNHDLCNSGVSIFLSKIKPYTSYYYLQTEKTSLYFLDTGNGTLGKNQLKDFKKVLHNDDNKKIIFTHYPHYAEGHLMFVLTNNMERAVLIDEYSKNNVEYLVTAHCHENYYSDYGTFAEISNTNFAASNSRLIITIDERQSETQITYKKF